MKTIISVTASFRILLSLFVCISVQSLYAQEEESEWTGTASFISRSVGTNSWKEKYNSGGYDLFSEYTMEATIVKGKGTGTARIKLKKVDKSSEWFDGSPSNCVKTEEGYAEASAATEMSVSFYDDAYSFWIYIPPVSGTTTIQENCTGASQSGTGKIGQDEGMIQVEFQPLKDPNILSGEIIERIDNPPTVNGGTISSDKLVYWQELTPVMQAGGYSETILKWTFTKLPDDVELIITPENYDKWLPQPGSSEQDHGATMNVRLNLKPKEGQTLKAKAASFKVILNNTSEEPGIAINYPAVKPDKNLPDIRILAAGQSTPVNNGQQITLPANDGESAEATLASYDGGGYTTLTAEAVLTDGRVIKGKLLKPSGTTEVLIPKRNGQRLIASAWTTKDPSSSDTEDNETSKGNQNNGDGLSAYEEYRGVFSGGKHIRLSNKKKELLVQIADKDLVHFKPGLSLLASAAGIEALPLTEKELSKNRLLNINSNSGKNGDQYALLLLNQPIGSASEKQNYGTTGINLPKPKYGKTIRESEKTIVDVAEITRSYAEQEAVVKKAKDQMPYTLQEEISSTVAHELAHGLNVYHHGDAGSDAARPINYTGKVKVVAFGSEGDKPLPYKQDTLFTSKIGLQGGESSGNLSCIMVYTNYFQWAADIKKGEHIHYHAVPLLPVGKIFCTAPDATGINKNPHYFGKATRGNCLAQLKIKAY
ncbi:hypothetical protein HHL16_23735 [Pseudoflavitalea sp. G-6-1-2]|uniref:hypothetical protein n=1 Tax=Pseudoflavitalea sp. G-6-1-2 TaxID=2728841 RepID=UPI00146BDB5B|nr:hypothetical protein [Pseudoflavitalea sp. G-6-1-2]NML23913.1 hypothetical protein [Pseudoflavitalea sp. G-6-1-2]